MEVVSGPDAGAALSLPNPVGTSTPAWSGGGLVKIWLRPLDQIQVAWNASSGITENCTTYLYGEVVAGTLQTLQ